MSSSINTNISAYYAQNNLRKAGSDSETSIARLSSGNKIIRASDDVAALSIGTILRTNVSTLKTALTNASQGSTLLQVADGAVARLGEILQRQKALAVQANSGTLSDSERGYLNQEFQSLKTEYDRIVETTAFNGVALLNGNIGAGSSLTAVDSTAVSVAGQTNDGKSGALKGGTLAFDIAGGVNDKVVGKIENGAISIAFGSATDGTANIVSVMINGQMYVSGEIDFTATGADISVTVRNASGEEIDFDIDETMANTAIDLDGLKDLSEDLTSDINEGITIYRTRAFENDDEETGYIDSHAFDGTILQGRDGSNFTLKAASFGLDGDSTPSVGKLKIVQVDNDATTPSSKMSVQVNGQTFSVSLTSGAGNNQFTLVAGTSAKLNAATYTLTNDANANETFSFTLTAANLADISSAAGVKSFEDAFNSVFNGGSAGGLKFQVGVQSDDTVGVAVTSVKSNAVYKNSAGDIKANLDISTQAGAIEASDVLDNAIKTLTSVRADIGALQSRFNYASATLEVSIQNLDAARGSFLDADISEESTKFASSQVLQQAAISVLAQANQLPQNLLKLLG